MKFNWFNNRRKRKPDRCFVVFYTYIVGRDILDGMTTVKESDGKHFSAVNFIGKLKHQNPNYDGVFIRGFKEMTQDDEKDLMEGLK